MYVRTLDERGEVVSIETPKGIVHLEDEVYVDMGPYVAGLAVSAHGWMTVYHISSGDASVYPIKVKYPTADPKHSYLRGQFKPSEIKEIRANRNDSDYARSRG